MLVKASTTVSFPEAGSQCGRFLSHAADTCQDNDSSMQEMGLILSTARSVKSMRYATI